MNPKTTDWISGDAKPVREGLYERKSKTPSESGRGYIDFYFYSFWDCYHEIWRSDTLTSAGYRGVLYDQNLPWRGLAEKPK